MMASGQGSYSFYSLASNQQNFLAVKETSKKWSWGELVAAMMLLQAISNTAKYNGLVATMMLLPSINGVASALFGQQCTK